MGSKHSDKQSLIADLSHQINSPLAAIRNALYLASCHTDDPQLLLRYLALADEEITTIADILSATREVIDHVTETGGEPRSSFAATRSAAA